MSAVMPRMVQGEIPEHRLAAVFDPMINLILMGSKTMSVGERTSRYDPVTYFVEALAQMAALSVSAFTDT